MRDRSHLRARGRAGRGSLERRLGIGIAGEFHQCITGEQFSVVDPLNANLGETALGDLVPLGSVAETVVAERDLQIELAFRILGRGLLVDRRRLAVGGQRVLGLSISPSNRWSGSVSRPPVFKTQLHPGTRYGSFLMKFHFN